MITESDSYHTLDMGPHFVILPQLSSWLVADYLKHFKAKKVKEGFRYSYGTNKKCLNAKQIRQLIRENVDEQFTS